jgi:hypothetical protein
VNNTHQLINDMQIGGKVLKFGKNEGITF